MLSYPSKWLRAPQCFPFMPTTRVYRVPYQSRYNLLRIPWSSAPAYGIFSLAPWPASTVLSYHGGPESIARSGVRVESFNQRRLMSTSFLSTYLHPAMIPPVVFVGLVVGLWAYKVRLSYCSFNTI